MGLAADGALISTPDANVANRTEKGGNGGGSQDEFNRWLERLERKGDLKEGNQ
jgi:hypothetical protein